MSLVKIQGNASGTGTLTIAAPNTNSDYTLTLPASSGTVATLATVTNNGVMYVNSSGQPTSGSALAFDGTNLGVGVTPSAWTRKAIQLGDAAAAYVANNSGGATVIATNMYFDGSNKYATTAAAARYSVGTGTHEWYTAPSGTAGNAITFNQAMTLDASQRLMIGTTSSYGGNLTLIPKNGNPTTASSTLNQIAIGEASVNSAYKLFVGYLNIGGGYAGSVQAIAGGAGTNLLLNADGGSVIVGDTSSQYSAKIYANGSIAARNGGVDGTYQDAFVAGYTSNYTEKNIIQTAVSSNGVSSGFRFLTSNGAGLSTTKTTLDLTRDRITFYNDGTERARIDSGNLLVNTTTARGKITATGSFSQGSTWSSTAAINVNGSFGGAVSFVDGSAGYAVYCSDYGADFYIQGAPNLSSSLTGGVYINDRATSWSSASDERLKTIIESIADAVNKVCQLRAVIGRYNHEAEEKRHPFLIAQDVQAVLPEAVSVADKQSKEQYLGVSYTDTIPLLVAAIQELKAIVDAQGAEIAALKGQA